MGPGRYLENLRSLYTENAPIINMGVFSFFFFVGSIVVLTGGNLPGGLILLFSALVLFGVCWCDIRNKGTEAYGRTITTEPWEVMPRWKKWAIFFAIAIYLLLFLWLFVTSR